MKKLMLLGIVGSMFVVGQSLVFANGTGSEKVMEFTKSIAAVEKGIVEGDVENYEYVADAVASTEAIASTEAETIAITEEKAIEFAKVLGLDSKEIQKLSMAEFLGNLSDEDFNKLVDAGAIEAMTASSVEAASIINEDGQAVETNNMEAAIEITVMAETSNK